MDGSDPEGGGGGDSRKERMSGTLQKPVNEKCEEERWDIKSEHTEQAREIVDQVRQLRMRWGNEGGESNEITHSNS